MAAKAIYVVEEKRDENELLWGPFREANEAAEWALKNLPGPMEWSIRPVKASDSINVS